MLLLLSSDKETTTVGSNNKTTKAAAAACLSRICLQCEIEPLRVPDPAAGAAASIETAAAGEEKVSDRKERYERKICNF